MFCPVVVAYFTLLCFQVHLPGASSRLGTRSHRFLSAATSSTDAAEAAAMALQRGGCATPPYTRRFPLPAKPALRSASLLAPTGYRPGLSQALGSVSIFINEAVRKWWRRSSGGKVTGGEEQDT